MEQRFFSPTSINCFLKCPRNYYYQYIKKVRVPKNIYMYRGSMVHSILEDVFNSKKFIDVEKFVIDELENRWCPESENIQDNSNVTDIYNETKTILVNFAKRFNDKVEVMIFQERVQDKDHAWNLLKPKLREYKIVNDELSVRGIIDSVETDFDDRLFLIDYKTSKIYKNLVSEDYIRQLRIYALLYYLESSKMPDFVGVNYLRYGETYFFNVTPDMLKLARMDIEFVKTNSVSSDMNDYPACNNKFCDHYYFEEKQDEEGGDKKWVKK